MLGPSAWTGQDEKKGGKRRKKKKKNTIALVRQERKKKKKKEERKERRLFSVPDRPQAFNRCCHGQLERKKKGKRKKGKKGRRVAPRPCLNLQPPAANGRLSAGAAAQTDTKKEKREERKEKKEKKGKKLVFRSEG